MTITADVSAHQLFLNEMDINSFNSMCHVLINKSTQSCHDNDLIFCHSSADSATWLRFRQIANPRFRDLCVEPISLAALGRCNRLQEEIALRAGGETHRRAQRRHWRQHRKRDTNQVSKLVERLANGPTTVLVQLPVDGFTWIVAVFWSL